MIINLIIISDGSRRWWRYDLTTHNKFGPAIVWRDGSKHWWQFGKCHRLDGPAIEYADGDVRWYIHGYDYNSYLEYLVAVEEYKRNQVTAC